MAQQVDGAAMPLDTEKVGIKGYLAFFLTIIFFSGVFSGSEGWWRVFDFTVLNGSFGHVTGTQTFRGAGGTGAKDGFLFALELAPSVILSLGIIAITDGLGGLRAAQQLMTPILKPLLGIPGICSLALIANLQNTDAAAGMTKELAQEGEEAAVFCFSTLMREYPSEYGYKPNPRSPWRCLRRRHDCSCVKFAHW